MKHFMPTLPYAQNALAPLMSEETIAYHYGKHLQAYVDNLNRLLPGTEYERHTLEELICQSSGAIFNNAAQVWNHRFFFESLTPTPMEMCEKLKEKIIWSFGSVERMKEKLLATSATLFGSGWVWLVLNNQCKMEIISGTNAANPLREGYIPLLTIDVWEHAYYIDHRNRRADYLETIWNLINWHRVWQRYENTHCNIYI